MGMVAILFNGPEPFEQIVSIPLTEDPIWNLKKMGQVVSEKKTFKEFMILYLYTAQGQGQITPGGGRGGKTLILTEMFTTLIIHCQPLVLNTYWKKRFFNFSPIQIFRDAIKRWKVNLWSSFEQTW